MNQRSVFIALILGIVLLMAFAGLIIAASGGSGGFGLRGRVAVLPIDGLIVDDRELLQQLDEFRDDRSVKGFVVAINSPGGVVAPSQSLYQELRELREEDDRPVIASIGSIGASGGYYIALGADSILALPGSITGSIGVLMEFPNAAGLLDKVGVEMDVIKSAEHKDLGSPFRALSDDDRTVLQSLVQDVYEQFVEVVVLERGLPSERVRQVADGRVLSGRQAIAAGLVDRPGNLSDAIALAGRMAGLGDDPPIKLPPEERFSVFDLLFGAPGASALRALARPIERRGPELKFITFY